MTAEPKRIVYVDDDPDIRALVRDAFEILDESYSICTCGSGQELLLRVKVLQPELILLDLRMPGMNGPDTILALREKGDEGRVPIIFVTGCKDVVMTAEYERLGVIGIIHKPFSVCDLPDLINNFWFEAYGAPVEEDENA